MVAGESYISRVFIMWKGKASREGAMKREKGRHMTQSYDKSPTPAEMSKGQSDNTNKATKKFDYKAISDRLRTVGWSNNGHPWPTGG